MKKHSLIKKLLSNQEIETMHHEQPSKEPETMSNNGTANIKLNLNTFALSQSDTNMLNEEEKENDDELKELLERFWCTENIHNVEDNSSGENDFLLKFKKHLKFNGERYVVHLQFKALNEILPDNYLISRKCLNNLLEKLKGNKHLKEEYANIIDEYVKAGIIEEVQQKKQVKVGEVHYLTHLPVVKERETTKTRIVFNGSLRNGKEPCLNV